MDPRHAAQERGAETDGPRRSEISAMMEKLAELNPTPNPAASAKLEGAPHFVRARGSLSFCRNSALDEQC